jgi:hypothetical protein
MPNSSPVYIRNLLGVIVYEGRILEGINSIDVSKLKSGLYVLSW